MSVLTGQQERLRILWRLSWPAIIEQVLGTMVSYVDAAMVGVLGAVGSAAVSVNGPPIWLLNGILAGVGVGYSVQVSNAVGANDPAGAEGHPAGLSGGADLRPCGLRAL